MRHSKFSLIIKRLRQAAFLLPLIFLAACAPPMSGTRLLMRSVLIQNTGSQPFTIKRVIANHSPENGNCNSYPDITLAAGESYTVAVLQCGTITHLDIVTDQGTGTMDF